MTTTTHALQLVEALLRPPRSRNEKNSTGKIPQLLGFILVGGIGYGAVMGTFGGFAGDRLWQLWFSGIKVPILLLTTFLISLPSFFIFNTLLGTRSDFPEVFHALLASQSGLTIILLAMAPYTAFWYLSFADYNQAVLFNGMMFAVASFTAQWLLRRYYQPLILRNPTHRLLLRVWLLVYVFVGIQMGWLLRPFVGEPSLPVQFVRSDAWGNAYVEVAKKFWALVTGS